jgi:hypothetical protein
MSRTSYFRIIVYISAFFVLQSSTFPSPIEKAVALAHQEIWKKFVDQFGIVNGYVGETPTPEDCSIGRPNFIGWRSPISDGAFFTGLYLTAMCEKAQRSGNKTDRGKAKQLANGLLRCASVSDVPGFIVRGVGTDGQCHYPVGSTDQTAPWFLGLYRYLKSGIPNETERQLVASKMEEVADALDMNDWKLPCDGIFKGQYRDDLKDKRFLEVPSYLFIIRAMYEITKKDIWNERYKTALFEYPRGSIEQPSASDKTRLEICASGYRIDSLIFTGRNIDKSQQWIYVKNQASLAQLVLLEKDKTIRAFYQTGLTKNAKNALGIIEDYKRFDNDDTKKFGHANWREGFPIWLPQKTQADAENLLKKGDTEKLGERRDYEKSFMTNPLAAAAITALAGDKANRESIERVICHYDFSKLNLSEFFFAEVAYYSLTAN